MRILLVAWPFPPFNHVAAIRLGKLARFLDRAGHDVRVIASESDQTDRSLAVEIDPERVTYVPTVDINQYLDPATILRRLTRRRGPAPAPQPGAGPAGGASAQVPAQEPARAAPGALTRLRHQLSEHYRCLIHMPDRHVGWALRLRPVLDRLCRDQRPDVIYVSGPPFSAFWPVRQAARRHRVPWVAEIRDLWADEAFPHDPAWRRAVDRRLEPWFLRSAAGIVSVSEPWTALYARKYGLPAATVMNGFDPDDFRPETLGTEAVPSPGLPLTIFHAGSIYRGRRDPTPLFRAIRSGGFQPDDVSVVFRGRGLDFVAERSAAEGVEAFVTLLPPVPYRDCLALQKAADVLLLLQWDDPANDGNVPAKIFEYLALARPVLVIGPQAGIPARLVRDREAGLAESDPDAIAAQLTRWVEEKRVGGTLPDLPASVHAGLSRDAQYAGLIEFLGRLTPEPPTGQQ